MSKAYKLYASSARSLSRSMRERHYYRYTVVPKALKILGVADLLEFAIADCKRQRDGALKRRHKNVARLLSDAIGVYTVALRRMRKVTCEGFGLAFCGDKKIMREFAREGRR